VSRRRIISEAVLERQRQASDPATSAWVSANAGSGKTHVLAQRVIRLLLSGIDPARILCITFTKAAAGNMANRVFDELRAWTALDDASLTDAMRAVGARDTGDTMRARARRLFALALETPGGLKVQTIHAFCTHILHLFPFEANVAASFSVLDDAEESQLLERMTNEVLLDAAASPGGDTGRALAYAITAAADSTFRERVSEAIDSRDALEAWLDAAGGLDGATAQLSKLLGCEPGETEDTIARRFFDESTFSEKEWAGIAAIGGTGNKTDLEQAARFASLPALGLAERIERYIDIFCTQTRENPRKTIFTGAVSKLHGPLCDRLMEERDRVWTLLERRRRIAARDRTMALVTIAKAVLDRFRAEKSRRGLLDFEDQIDKTRDLLSRISAAWVHYKLDSGIEHVLIDEAQDTSPKQWDIVMRLTAEFFAGVGASDRRRTIFAVGDEKQSIYSFQGAAPEEFEAKRREFETMARRSEQPFRLVRFDTSLRSGANVLSAVDIVFRPGAVALSLTRDEAGVPDHIALASAAPGDVEIWDTEKPDKNGGETDPWNAPFDRPNRSKPHVKLAERIAASVKSSIAGGRRAGDVLILVNRRGALFEAIIRALKRAHVAVAGADRLVLSEHIAVMDLMVLADALLLPDDDLALATALKSPLFGLDDDDLIALAAERGGRSLRAALAGKAKDNGKFKISLDRLEHFAALARTATPFVFYARILGAGKGRKQFLARLGHEANDALDEFLNLALDYERMETPTLQGFVDWLRAAKSEVKRDMEIVRDEVRVMTVHGAKGLEAPVVYLADTTTRPESHHLPALLPLSDEPGAPLIWIKAEKEDVGPMTEARASGRKAIRDEHLRLLYVAMTRAAERLVVCGVESRKRPDGCWYDLILNGLKDEAGTVERDDGGRTVWHYRKAVADAVESEDTEPEIAAACPDAPWLMQPLPPQPPSRRLRPSDTDGAIPAQTEAAGAARRGAAARGVAMHRLLQSLPGVAPDQRAGVAHAFLARQMPVMPQAERDTLVALTVRLLNDLRFAHLFLPGSRAEVSLAGTIEIGGAHYTVAGQIDRLVVTDSEVLIADYKTNRPAPSRIADVPPAYVRQLALYRALLAQVYPGRAIRAALIWTEVPDLMELSDAALDDALAQITAP
jgi:ATP-dependent helicase/nuclease subunit A